MKTKKKATTLAQLIETARKEGVIVTQTLHQPLLYRREYEETKTYTLEINTGGELGVTESGQVQITFKNGEFHSVQFPFKGNYTRNGWRILAAIETEIQQIEAQLKTNR